MVNLVKRFLIQNIKLITDYFTVIFGTAMGRGISFVTSIIIARFMGTHGFGVFSLFFTVFMLSWQLPSIIDAMYIRYVKVEAKGNTVEYLRANFFFKCCVTVILTVISWPLSYLLAKFVFLKPETVNYLTMAIIAGAFISIFSSFAGIYLAQEKFRLFSFLNFIFYFVVFACVLLLAVFLKNHFTPFVLIVIYSVIAMTIGLLGAAYIHKQAKPIFPINTLLISNMIHFGKWLLADSIIFITIQRIDMLFLARHTTFTELGIYSAAVRMAMVASLFSAAASAIFMPKGCESLKSQKHLNNYFREITLVVLLLSAFITLLIFFSPLLINLFFGKNFTNAVTPTRILFLEAIFTVCYTPLSYIFYATGKSKQIFKLSLTKIIIAILLLQILTPKYGSTGAALSISISSLCGLICTIFLTIKTLKNIKNQEIFSEKTEEALI